MLFTVTVTLHISNSDAGSEGAGGACATQVLGY